MAPTAPAKGLSVKGKKSRPVPDPPLSKTLKRKKSEAATPEDVVVEDVSKKTKKQKIVETEKSTEVLGKSGRAAEIPKAGKGVMPSKKDLKTKEDRQDAISPNTNGKEKKMGRVKSLPAATTQVPKSVPVEKAKAPTSKATSKTSGKTSKAKPASVADTASIPIPSPPPAASKSKKSKKAPSPESEPAPENIESDASEEENDHLHGFSTDDDDSSDEEDAMNEETSAFDVSKLPTIAKDDATVKRKLEKAKNNPTEHRGVLFISRLPHGFYEDQMKAYFSQFGNVTRLRLSRNKKTGKSKHYGFIEFDSSSVAQIVADTMDNYLIMGHILRCKIIPKDEVHPELWVGANRKWRVVPQARVTRVAHNKPRTDQEQARAARRLLKRQAERNRKLKEAGIKYDFEAVGYKIQKGTTTT